MKNYTKSINYCPMNKLQEIKELINKEFDSKLQIWNKGSRTYNNIELERKEINKIIDNKMELNNIKGCL